MNYGGIEEELEGQGRLPDGLCPSVTRKVAVPGA